jgi:hypothetical protein
MIRSCDRPKCYKDLKGDYSFFACFDDDRTYAYGATGYAPPTVMLHIEVVREQWSHKTLKQMIFDWHELTDMWRSVGIENVLITKEGLLTDNEPWIKFLSFFGISRPGQIMAINHSL